MDASTDVELRIPGRAPEPGGRGLQLAQAVVLWPVPDPAGQPGIDLPQQPHGPLEPAGVGRTPFKAEPFADVFRQHPHSQQPGQRHQGDA